jgi:prevent-host-death family protein
VITVGAYEAKTPLSELLALVSKGEVVTITKHDHPIAMLTPVAPAHDVAEAVAAMKGAGPVAVVGDRGQSLVEGVASMVDVQNDHPVLLIGDAVAHSVLAPTSEPESLEGCA